MQLWVRCKPRGVARSGPAGSKGSHLERPLERKPLERTADGGQSSLAGRLHITQIMSTKLRGGSSFLRPVLPATDQCYLQQFLLKEPKDLQEENPDLLSKMRSSENVK